MNNIIYINQIGYLPSEKKFAYVYESLLNGADSFSLVDSNGKTVYSGKISAGVKDELIDQSVCCCDFSDFSDEGNFTICIGNNKNKNVRIGTSSYNDLYYSVLNYFYMSRCGHEIVDCDKWSHPACHTDIAEIYGTKETKLVTGGWHDAGDYGRYVVAGSKAVMDLLLAYEYSKDKFNAFDILSEVRFELDWLLQMQREDGGVYHKISCYHFCGFILPQDEKDKIVISPVSTAATCDFAGCLAYASTFYKKEDPAFADKLLKAAVKAQDYVDKHEDEIFSNPPEITTGSYGDWNVSDERYFALCSLFAATGDRSYLNKALEIRSNQKNKTENYQEPWKLNWYEGFSWGCVSGYGSEILLKNQQLVGDRVIVEDIRNGILEIAVKILEDSKKSSFGLSLTKIFWGSNGAVCDHAHIFLLAYDLTGNKEFYDAALKNLNYVLGCNPIDMCYVTKNGVNSPVKPHHRQSGFLNDVMPGMLAGGPSAGLQDAVAKEKLQGKSPLMCYIDDTGSYSTNEIAIYWNSPLVYVIARLALL